MPDDGPAVDADPASGSADAKTEIDVLLVEWRPAVECSGSHEGFTPDQEADAHGGSDLAGGRRGRIGRVGWVRAKPDGYRPAAGHPINKNYVMAEDEQAHRGACRVGRCGGPGRRLSSDDGARADDREVDPEQALDEAAEPIRPGRNGRRVEEKNQLPRGTADARVACFGERPRRVEIEELLRHAARRNIHARRRDQEQLQRPVRRHVERGDKLAEGRAGRCDHHNRHAWPGGEPRGRPGEQRSDTFRGPASFSGAGFLAATQHTEQMAASPARPPRDTTQPDTHRHLVRRPALTIERALQSRHLAGVLCFSPAGRGLQLSLLARPPRQQV
jgi:hypothetical protein